MQSTLKGACLTALLLVLAVVPGVQGPKAKAAQSLSIVAGDNPKTGSGTG